MEKSRRYVVASRQQITASRQQGATKPWQPFMVVGSVQRHSVMWRSLIHPVCQTGASSAAGVSGHRGLVIEVGGVQCGQRRHGRNLSWLWFATRGCGCPCNTWRVCLNVEALSASFAFDVFFAVLGGVFVPLLFAHSITLWA